MASPLPYKPVTILMDLIVKSSAGGRQVPMNPPLVVLSLRIVGCISHGYSHMECFLFAAGSPTGNRSFQRHELNTKNICDMIRSW